jgi:adenosylcobinamide-GDP ribazoletransferase
VEKRLAIMKDSRIGAYGALALLFGVALRVSALAELPLSTAAAALIAAHAAARITPAFVMNALPYAGDTAAMKVSYADAPVSSNDIWFALLVVGCALVPLALVSISSVISGLLLGALLAAAVALWARRLIDGYTGDVLGAIEQMFEIGFLLGVAAIIR